MNLAPPRKSLAKLAIAARAMRMEHNPYLTYNPFPRGPDAMSETPRDALTVDRREFLRTTASGLAAAGVMLTPRERALAQSLAEKARFERMAGCTWPIRSLFKTRQNPNRGGGAGTGGRAGGAPAGGGAAAAPAPAATIPGIP